VQATDKFQGKCLINAEGWEFMEVFDGMPAKARDRLRHSPFNLSAACVDEEAYNQLMRSGDTSYNASHYIKAIEKIEAQIMAEETTEG